ncbi:MAG: hypothetical protein IJM33_01780 [Bacteroidales bacterium]|nr:hypothetical protein [Bacteroidales bacterium]MBR3412665.1 hypothetical protein [Bacteroidales bacterium]
MIKNFKRLTVLLFVAATMLTFNACTEKENGNDNPQSPSTPYQAKESDILGKWYIPSTSPDYGGDYLEFKSNHTMSYNGRSREYVWTLNGNTLESTFTSLPDQWDRTWWEKFTLTVKNYEEVAVNSNYTDKFLTVEGMFTTNYNGVITNTGEIDTSGIISGRLSQRVRNN